MHFKLIIITLEIEEWKKKKKKKKHIGTDIFNNHVCDVIKHIVNFNSLFSAFHISDKNYANC